MKGLTLWQPWATLVAIGAKSIETRSWSTSYRGLLAIHAAKNFPDKSKELLFDEPFFGALNQFVTDHPSLPYGLPVAAIVAVCELVACVSTNDIGQTWNVSIRERSFGDYSPNRYGWLLKNIRELKKPIPCRGAMQLWNMPTDIERMIEEQLR